MLRNCVSGKIIVILCSPIPFSPSPKSATFSCYLHLETNIPGHHGKRLNGVHSYRKFISWDWDRLGPGTLCYSACTWIDVSSRNSIQRNCKGLKITVCMRSWGQIMDNKIQNNQKNPSNCHFWGAGSKNRVPGAKAGYCTCPLHSTPPKGWANHLSHTFHPTPGHTPTLTPYKEPAHPPHWGASKGTSYSFLLPPVASGAPIKSGLNFLTGLLPISIDWGRPRTRIGIRIIESPNKKYYKKGCKEEAHWA